MNANEWDRLTEWHSAWLAAGERDRVRLRDRLAAMDPALLPHADELIASTPEARDFLETPAFVLAAERLARDAAPLGPGRTIGPYRIVALIGRGGMGMVYRARDSRLDRDVALKMLLPIGVPDELQVERFVREARLTASVDHPNVIKVFDVGVFEGQPYMVVELLEGETLRARLERGALPTFAAHRVAVEIARGLVAAHAAGLVHRDLKPENVFVTRAGVTKILDFGIAKLAPDAARRRGATSTLTGILLGTAGYLAPEQIRGDEVDARADLFSLGSMLVEMLTGQRAFACENTVDTLHAIVHSPAPDLLAQPGLPVSLARITMRLLEKAPADRFQSSADLVWALEQIGDAPPATRAVLPAPRTKPRIGLRALLIAASLAAIALVAFARWPRSAPAGGDPPLARFPWILPDGTGLSSAPAVSPDGRYIAWTAFADGSSRLFVRALSEPEATVPAGTESALHPFWSTDSTTVGFFARGRLKKVAIDGGAPVDLAAAPAARGGAWSPAGVIVFQPDYRDAPLLRVPDRGGVAEPATTLDGAQDEVGHRWPMFLPDGRHFLYAVTSARDYRRGIAIGSLDTPGAPPGPLLFASDSAAIFAPLSGGSHGVLLSIDNGRIEARLFDPVRRVVLGDARTIGIAAVGTSPHHGALLSASPDVLAYGAAPIPWGFRFSSVNRDGTDLQIGADRELGGFPRISPDGRRLARTVVDTLRGNPDIWVDDLDRGGRLRLTTSSTHDVVPVWSPDGGEVAYRSGTVREPAIGIASADGAGERRTIPCPERPCEATDWSEDGYLLVNVRGADIWKVPLAANARPAPLFAEAHTERDARISPDGRWLVYVSDETGRPEVSVQSISGPRRRFPVSTVGGDQPVWRREGGELFFVDLSRQLFSVSVHEDRGRLVFGTPERLNVPTLGERHWGTIYDVSKDGRRIYFPHTIDEQPPRELGVVLGWRRLVSRD